MSTSRQQKRPYTMRKRAEDVGATRDRITEAAVRLHTTIGPARTTISAVAEGAGVTRLTVYRHFPTEDELFRACTTHWRNAHPAPDPSTWATLPQRHRVTTALTELYGWYAENADALMLLRRDADAMPTWVREGTMRMNSAFAEMLISGSKVRGHARRRLRAVAGLVVDYRTWRSLVVEQGLTNDDAVELGGAFLRAATGSRGR